MNEPVSNPPPVDRRPYKRWGVWLGCVHREVRARDRQEAIRRFKEFGGAGSPEPDAAYGTAEMD